MACMHKSLARMGHVACVLLLLAVAALDCSTGQQGVKPAAPAPAALIQTGFAITLTYSKKAMDTLVARKETVIVAAYVTGFPKPGTPKKLVGEDGSLDIGGAKQEVAPGANASFGKIALDPKSLRYADQRGAQLLVNVYSGRKSSPNNLLDCGIYEGPLKDAQGKSLPIACKIIGEQ